MILNDTRDFHCGSAKVMDYLEKFDRTGVCLVNGEGTMHHNRPPSIDLLQKLRLSLQNGSETMLVNTVWDSMDMDDDMVDTLKNSYVSTREIKSWKELQKWGIDSDIHLDCSYWSEVEYKKMSYSSLRVGDFYGRPSDHLEYEHRINIHDMTWDDLVNTLRHTEFFVTGRHHEMYASCKARCPFFVIDGNTHKNTGLIEWSGAEIPCVDDQFLKFNKLDYYIDMCRERLDEYNKLWDFMDSQPRLVV